MNPLGIASKLLGAGFNQSEYSAVGPTNVGQTTTFTSYSPFAVGRGATATASGGEAEPVNFTKIGLIALAALVAIRLLR